jgi:hypothetical protein
MKPCKFTSDFTPTFDGFAHGSKWNGFDNVAVTPEELNKIVAYFKSVGDLETADDLDHIEMMENDLISLGWGYTTRIVTARYIVRDIATKGCDFLVWGDDDEAAAKVSLEQAKADGLDVELVVMPADAMDDHTRKLIEG